MIAYHIYHVIALYMDLVEYSESTERKTIFDQMMKLRLFQKAWKLAEEKNFHLSMGNTYDTRLIRSDKTVARVVPQHVQPVGMLGYPQVLVYMPLDNGTQALYSKLGF